MIWPSSGMRPLLFILKGKHFCPKGHYNAFEFHMLPDRRGSLEIRGAGCQLACGTGAETFRVVANDTALRRFDPLRFRTEACDGLPHRVRQWTCKKRLIKVPNKEPSKCGRPHIKIHDRWDSETDRDCH